MGLSFYCHFSLALMLVALFLRYALLNCQCLFFSKWMCHKKEKLNNAGIDHAKRQECVISLLTQIWKVSSHQRKPGKHWKQQGTVLGP